MTDLQYYFAEKLRNFITYQKRVANYLTFLNINIPFTCPEIHAMKILFQQSNFKLFNPNTYKSKPPLKIKKQLGYIVSSLCIILLQDIKWYTLTISERKKPCSFWCLFALVQIALKKSFLLLTIFQIRNWTIPFTLWKGCYKSTQCARTTARIYNSLQNPSWDSEARVENA